VSRLAHNLPFLSYARLPGDHQRRNPRPVLNDMSQVGTSLPLRITRNLAGGIVEPHHLRIPMMRIHFTSIASSLRLPPGRKTTATPAASFRLRFFAARQSYQSTQLRLPHRTDSVYYASVHPTKRSSFRKFAMRKDAAGAYASPRAGYPKIWSACSRNLRNSRSNWVRHCRG
jgi:hypothetical protein